MSAFANLRLLYASSEDAHAMGPANPTGFVALALTNPDSVRTYLTGVGLPAGAPVIAPARPPPQPEFEFAV